MLHYNTYPGEIEEMCLLGFEWQESVVACSDKASHRLKLQYNQHLDRIYTGEFS